MAKPDQMGASEHPPLTQSQNTDGPLMQTAQWLSNHYTLPFLPATIQASLPDDFEVRGSTVLPRILEAAGFTSAFVRRKIDQIDPVVLPCVLFGTKGAIYVLTELDGRKKRATVVTIAEGRHTREIMVRELRRIVEPEILLVTPNADLVATRLDPIAAAPSGARGHWLWQPVLANWNGWLQILICAVAINLLGLALPLFVMNVYDRVIPNLSFVTLWTLAAGVGIALFLDLLLKLVRTQVLELVSRRIDLQIASNLYRHALGLTLLGRPGGAAGTANQIRDFESVRDFFGSSSFVAIIDFLFIGIFLAVLYAITGPLAYVPMIAVPIVIVLALIAQVPISASVERAQQIATKRHVVLVESLMGHETIKSLNAEPVMQREWENAVAASARINGKTRLWSNVAISGTMLVQQAVSVVIIVWGVLLVAEGQVSIGALIAANILAGRAIGPLANISQTLIRANQALKSMGAINALKSLPTETDGHAKNTMVVRDGALELRNITFSYPDAQVAALDGINLSIAKGECVAVLGRVGSGKSTLGRLITGLIEPDSGLILIDGNEAAQFSKTQMREGIGYLPQDPELFTGSIRENLVLGRPRATEDEIRQALYLSGLDYFIQENPEGLNQFVGEKGSRLSGGQRQSIGLARLLLRQPKMMFLDEPTNAMDASTENIVIERLQELSRSGVGLILSTHRQSLAAIAERYVIIERGKKVLDGPKETVLKALSGAPVASAAPDKAGQ